MFLLKNLNLKEIDIASENITRSIVYIDGINQKIDIEKKINKNKEVFGNLPYNISSQILIKFLKFKLLAFCSKKDFILSLSVNISSNFSLEVLSLYKV